MTQMIGSRKFPLPILKIWRLGLTRFLSKTPISPNTLSTRREGLWKLTQGSNLPDRCICHWNLVNWSSQKVYKCEVHCVQPLPSMLALASIHGEQKMRFFRRWVGLCSVLGLPVCLGGRASLSPGSGYISQACDQHWGSFALGFQV